MGRYNILVVDDDKVVRELFAKNIELTGNNPIIFSRPEDAITYLVDNYRRTALVFCDLEMDGVFEKETAGYHVLETRNGLDRSLPFYLVSGRALPQDTDHMGRKGMNGYIAKPIQRWDLVRQMIETVLADHVECGKPVVVEKFGGSADDHDFETDSYAAYEALRFQRELQKDYQVILTVGAGQFGDIWKMRRRKHGRTCPTIERKHPERIARGLDENIDYVADLIGEDMAVPIRTEQMLDIGRTYFPDNNPRKSSPDLRDELGLLESILAQDKVIVMGTAPRHLLLGHDDIVDDPKLQGMIPLQDSDSHTVLIAEYFGADKIMLIKRADNVYRFDCNKGMRRGARVWKMEQVSNEPLDVVLVDDLIGNGKPPKVSRIGAWDLEDGHLFETSGLKLFRKSSVVRQIQVVHVAPFEMYVGGTHAVTGSSIPSLDESGLRERNLRGAIEGTYLRGVITK